MAFDIKKVVPWLAAALTGGAPALAGMAVTAVGEALQKDFTKAPVTEIVAAVKGATPEQLAALQASEQDFKLKMTQAGYTHVEELAKIEAGREAILVEDAGKAREAFKNNENVIELGKSILVIFAITVLMTLIGSYILVVTPASASIQPGVLAAIFGLIGSVVGYVAAIAQQVVGFYFGSSSGSKEHSENLREAIATLGAAR